MKGIRSKKSTTPIAKREEQFQEALENWLSTGESKYWDEIYYRVYDACHNITAKMLTGVSIDPERFEDHVMDSTLYTLKRIKQGMKPKKLSSYCYLVCKGIVHGKKTQFQDSIVYLYEYFPSTEAKVLEDE